MRREVSVVLFGHARVGVVELLGDHRHRHPPRIESTEARVWRNTWKVRGAESSAAPAASGRATPTGSADDAGATDNLKLAFRLDHSAGVDHHLYGS
jgi:hypothetical protein